MPEQDTEARAAHERREAQLAAVRRATANPQPLEALLSRVLDKSRNAASSTDTLAKRAAAADENDERVEETYYVDGTLKSALKGRTERTYYPNGSFRGARVLDESELDNRPALRN